MFCHYPLLRICSYSHIEQILNYDMVLLPCDAMRSTVLVIVILSVRLSVSLSVRLSHSWTVSTWFDL